MFILGYNGHLLGTRGTPPTENMPETNSRNAANAENISVGLRTAPKAARPPGRGKPNTPAVQRGAKSGHSSPTLPTPFPGARLHRLRKNSFDDCPVKGHGFSRAESASHQGSGFSPCQALTLTHTHVHAFSTRSKERAVAAFSDATDTRLKSSCKSIFLAHSGILSR